MLHFTMKYFFIMAPPVEKAEVFKTKTTLEMDGSHFIYYTRF